MCIASCRQLQQGLNSIAQTAAAVLMCIVSQQALCHANHCSRVETQSACVLFRYALNWVKMRVWEQEQWDGIIMIDVDVTVLGDLSHLFKLPTDFAAVPDNGKIWNRRVMHVYTMHGIRHMSQHVASPQPIVNRNLSPTSPDMVTGCMSTTPG